MAAYAALVSLMKIIHQIEHHPSLPISMDKKQVESLTEIVALLQEFLEGYKSPYADGDEADPLEMRISNAVYAAEDVIESHIVDRILPGLYLDKRDRIGFFNCFRGLKEPKNYGPKITSTDLYKSLVKVIKDLDLIKKEVIAIVAVKDQLQRQVSTSAAGSSTSLNKLMSCFNSWRSLQSNMEIVAVKYQPMRQVSTSAGSSCRLNNTTMVGSDDVMLQLMEKLTYGEPGRQVIPIVGMAGIGKTTLATNVYAKPLITHHFDICVWVTISQQYNTKELLSEILSQVNKEGKERVSKINEDEIGLLLHKHLSYRRYLIVLDDMWTIEAWEEIQCYFPDYGNGSRIIVTTRLSNLGSQLDSNYGIEIKFMDDESSWDLFCKIVFRKKNCPLELEQIGKKIVKSCRGLPLSIVVMGGLLEKLERIEECWESITENLNSLVNSQNKEHCLKILKLSYNQLPVYLKPCFLYMGTYEEDSQIRVSTIIKIWVSEGFLKPTSGKGLETIAKEYLDELVDRNLVLVHKFGKTGNMKYCKIHDLFRDLCLREARKERFYHVVGKHSPRGTCSQRRVVIPRRISKQEVIDSMISTPYARSCISDRKIVPMLSDLRLLRTLRACDEDFYGGYAYTMGKLYGLVNLRLLIFIAHRFFDQIPTSINLLWSLETIIVSSPEIEVNVPVEIWKMPQLRHVYFHLMFGRLHLPDILSDSIVIMENLQTLKGVKNFKFDEMMVRKIPNIRKLRVIEDIGSRGDDYCAHNIKRLQKLESLHCYCNSGFSRKLTFPHSLKSLTLSINDGRMEDILEKLSRLPLLQKLKLYGGHFTTGKWETIEGQFLSLKYLSLSYCHRLECWMMESSHFPCLEHVHLFNLTDLKEIPVEFGEIPTLKSVVLEFCSESAIKSAKRMVEEQEELQGEEELSFKVAVRLGAEDQELQSLANPNFQVNAR